jgi:hypothetical protein
MLLQRVKVNGFLDLRQENGLIKTVNKTVGAALRGRPFLMNPHAQKSEVDDEVAASLSSFSTHLYTFCLVAGHPFLDECAR